MLKQYKCLGIGKISEFVNSKMCGGGVFLDLERIYRWVKAMPCDRFTGQSRSSVEASCNRSRACEVKGIIVRKSVGQLLLAAADWSSTPL